MESQTHASPAVPSGCSTGIRPGIVHRLLFLQDTGGWYHYEQQVGICRKGIETLKKSTQQYGGNQG
jgi:hypothetical protein